MADELFDGELAQARAAHDVLCRHGEDFSLVQLPHSGKWMVDGPEGWIRGQWRDPFTALIEADKIFEAKKASAPNG